MEIKAWIHTLANVGVEAVTVDGDPLKAIAPPERIARHEGWPHL
jgi:hypothetical protein